MHFKYKLDVSQLKDLKIEESERLVSDGKLSIPLFHGTSSLFLDSIMRHGLGGENPVVELGIIEKLSRAIQLADKHLCDMPEWKSYDWVFRKIVNQESSNRANFRHGATYMTPSEFTARNYATSNKYGSECLDHLRKLLELLGPFAAELTVELDSSLERFNVVDMVPILIEVDGIEVGALRTEDGRDPAEQLNLMQSFMDNHGTNSAIIFQQMNFELMRPISSDRLKTQIISS